jgi:hypothetical protein
MKEADHVPGEGGEEAGEDEDRVLARVSQGVLHHHEGVRQP